MLEPVLDNNTSESSTDVGKILEINSAVGSSTRRRFWVYLGLAGAFFVVFLVTLGLCLNFRGDYKAQLAAHNDCIEMINYAKEHEICNLEGTVTSFDIDKDTGRYAVGYRVVSESNVEGQLDAFSPYVYTLDEIEQNFVTGSKIRVAIEDGALNQKTKSVNMSYENYDLMTYPPFKNAKVGFITMLVALSVCFFIVCCFVGFAMQALADTRKEDPNCRINEVEVVKPDSRATEH